MIALLIAQALAFGVMLALVVVPANAIFLDAYGAKWLPATYIGIAVFGTAASAFIARAARRTRLVRVATVSLSAIAVLYAASWLILLGGGVWVSAALLVLFPIALQMGFVFIGGQAGRLLDVRQMKERFPRVVGGFSVGFLARWPPRHPAPRPARLDREPAARHDGRAARVPRPPARDGAEVPRGPRGSGRDAAASRWPGRRHGCCSGQASC